MRNNHVPTVTEVDRISAIQDPILRNLQITQCYHELSAVLSERTGLSANWCTFATWASKQAGQTIRKEDLVQSLENILDTDLIATQAVRDIATSAQQVGAKRDTREIQESVWKILNPFIAIDQAGDAVGRGNKKVFEEIGREFARFFSTCLHDEMFDVGKIGRFCDELRPGDPPDGQRYLSQAFPRYYQSFFEDDAKKRAELYLLANIEIGFHEQTRLQPEIAEALNAAITDYRQFTHLLIKIIFPSRGWPTLVQRLLIRLLGRLKPFDAAINTLIATARQKARLVITEHLMTISLPHERLQLGKDLNAEFPVSLKEIANPDLRALLERIDPTPNSLHETGAVDWADLPDRLHFIVDLFRCYQESQDLFEPPFTPEQVTTLKSGHLPVGQL
ncbi:MAG: hypothetical protein DYG83_03700 [Candidatus Brocadia sp. AMX2]|uniref:hypothetical protein n=1 Tax=Candidatus Brocadia TaxID=380240 RepID=UPI000695D3BE|nr:MULTISPECIES: hypothetical protein [Brocadia]KXK30916.1 MAG: hypothetical protein UZ01_01037 [Candidatus Brocadia sinica]MBC6931232.1 hypothetical protein [Candidatus Brocadia sp.]MBL1168597.1 hypothetical protein [Candidatus Brocadia sp. AMX1]NOG40133.1 hypothetical protein [Planctomycetota bacterium]KAA0246067.1 MAG: hypothetical protein EDM70_00315 [Candidatus Brocadia sp. AMX2]